MEQTSSAESPKTPKTPERLRPSLSRESDENQCISLAVDEAKRMLVERKAPTSVILHYLKLATTTAELEKETIRLNQELMIAKKELLESQARSEELFTKAMKAMRKYTGAEDDGDEEY